MMFAGVIVFLSGFFFFKGGITEVSTIIAARDPLLTAVINPKSLHMYSYATVFCVILIEFAFSGQPHSQAAADQDSVPAYTNRQKF